MTMERKERTEDICLRIQGNGVEFSDNLILLGITIDKKMNFNEHSYDVCKKASRRVGVILRLKKLIPTEAKLHL